MFKSLYRPTRADRQPHSTPLSRNQLATLTLLLIPTLPPPPPPSFTPLPHPSSAPFSLPDRCSRRSGEGEGRLCYDGWRFARIDFVATDIRARNEVQLFTARLVDYVMPDSLALPHKTRLEHSCHSLPTRFLLLPPPPPHPSPSPPPSSTQPPVIQALV